MGITESKTMHLSKQQLISLYHLMVQANDYVNANKIIDLFNKMEKSEYIVGFTGHFSAGKSSIINFLLNKAVLPSSPIPTSANIVKIKNGKGNVKVYFNNKTAFQYDEPYDLDVIKEYCMDKETIKQLEINLSNTPLPEHLVMIDTPGIDAADDTDRFITESALHLVDLLFYVMDYNHVQSEVNLRFLQKIQQQRIPMYILINQIDKHQEEEISFKNFEKSINQTFDQWGITYKKIYFTSTIDENNVYNELYKMKKDFYHLLPKCEMKINRNLIAAEILLDEHKQYMKNMYSNKIHLPNDEEIDNAKDLFEEFETELAHLHSIIPNLKKEFDHEIQITLKNAYIMPAKLRELAGYFLESKQKDFKVGFIRSKKKTDIEKKQRVNQFLQQLKTSMSSSIEWKLREKLTTLLQTYNIHDEHIIKQVQNLTVEYTEQDLFHFMKDGATINGNYILNYTNDISNDIKNKYRQKGNKLWHLIAIYYEPILHVKIKEVENKRKKLKENLHLLKKDKEAQSNLKRTLAKIDDAFYYPIITEMEEKEVRDKVLKSERVIKQGHLQKMDKNKRATSAEHHNVTKNVEKKYHVASILQTLDQFLMELEQIEELSSVIQDLQDQKFKLSNRQLTIALFGAFSAGKSSFANALFGEQLLPVSPNPTTAVINRITAPKDKYPHSTVEISFKDEQSMVEDIERITNNHLKEKERLFDFVKRILNSNKSLPEMYRAYLKAIMSGYNGMQHFIGNKMIIPLQDFPNFITDETKACFIERVDLYYDCPLTKKGITIVDTPGANSIHARHTNVAFDYIKNADAILYVTYYNHAITSADRDFLMQLGRVKEAFELDKMFFIVNAADLANTQNDIKLVLQYVEDQLVKLGIRQPKIFPVSSKLALEEKKNKLPLNVNMADFEQSLHTFIEEDLAQLMMQSALWDMKRATSSLKQFIHAANLDISEQEKYKQQLHEKRIACLHIIEREETYLLKQRLIERIKRQLHYVMERLSIRFHDIFKEHFNPTTITNEGRKAQEDLMNSGKKLIDYIGYELLQEIRAVSLRIESYMNELLHGAYDHFHNNMVEIDQMFIIPSFEPLPFDTPLFEQAFITLDVREFSSAFKLFKNKKAFFENNERENMKEKLYELLQPFASKYVTEMEELLEQRYELQFDEKTEKMKQAMINEINDIINRQLKLIAKPSQIDLLQKKYATVTSLMEVQMKG